MLHILSSIKNRKADRKWPNTSTLCSQLHLTITRKRSSWFLNIFLENILQLRCRGTVCRSDAEWDRRAGSQGQGGGRVYTLRNVDVETREWTGRVMLGSTLSRNRQDTRVFHAQPTLIHLRMSQFFTLPPLRLLLGFSRESNFYVSVPKILLYFPTAGLLLLYRSHRKLAGVKLQSLGLAWQSQNYRHLNVDI